MSNSAPEIVSGPPVTLFGVGGTYARVSADGRYRYWLGRRWDDELPTAVFVMLNPSTADAEVDDPTIRKCRGFARRWGCGGFWVVNLFALRATEPADMWRFAGDRVGPENDAYLRRVARGAEVAGWPVVVAWGTHGERAPERVARVREVFERVELQCLGRVKSGHPRHPLMTSYEQEREPW